MPYLREPQVDLPELPFIDEVEPREAPDGRQHRPLDEADEGQQTRSPLQNYIDTKDKEIQDRPGRLIEDELKELASRGIKGDEESRSKFVDAALPFIRRQVRKMNLELHQDEDELINLVCMYILEPKKFKTLNLKTGHLRHQINRLTLWGIKAGIGSQVRGSGVNRNDYEALQDGGEASSEYLSSERVRHIVQVAGAGSFEGLKEDERASPVNRPNSNAEFDPAEPSSMVLDRMDIQRASRRAPEYSQTPDSFTEKADTAYSHLVLDHRLTDIGKRKDRSKQLMRLHTVEYKKALKNAADAKQTEHLKSKEQVGRDRRAWLKKLEEEGEGKTLTKESEPTDNTSETPAELPRDGSSPEQAILVSKNDIRLLQRPNRDAQRLFMSYHGLEPGSVWLHVIGATAPAKISTEVANWGSVIGGPLLEEWRRNHPEPARIEPSIV